MGYTFMLLALVMDYFNVYKGSIQFDKDYRANICKSTKSKYLHLLLKTLQSFRL